MANIRLVSAGLLTYPGQTSHRSCSPPSHRSCSPPSHRSCSPPSHSSCSPPSHRAYSPPWHRSCSPLSCRSCSPLSHRSCSPPSCLSTKRLVCQDRNHFSSQHSHCSLYGHSNMQYHPSSTPLHLNLILYSFSLNPSNSVMTAEKAESTTTLVML